MKKQFVKAMALTLALILLCSACGLGAATATPTPAATDAGSSAAPSAAPSSSEVTVGLEKNKHTIPDYTNAGADVRVLRLSVSMGEADYGVSASGMMFKTFVDKLEELSGGKVVAQVYPANQLASTTDDIVNGLMTGAFEMSEVGVANWGDYTTAFTAMNTPFLYATDKIAYEVISGEVGKSMFEQFNADTGIHAMGFLYLGMRTITNNIKEIHVPSDLKGMKIRVQNDPTQLAAFEALGCSVMTTSFSELFTALQQKLCDGQDNPVITNVSKKFYEVQKYMTMLNHLPSISLFVMGDPCYSSLSAEELAWVEQAASEATAACYQTCLDTMDILIGQLEDYGIVVTRLTDDEQAQFAACMKDVWTMCEETMGTDKWNALQTAVKEAEAKG